MRSANNIATGVYKRDKQSQQVHGEKRKRSEGHKREKRLIILNSNSSKTASIALTVFQARRTTRVQKTKPHRTQRSTCTVKKNAVVVDDTTHSFHHHHCCYFLPDEKNPDLLSVPINTKRVQGQFPWSQENLPYETKFVVVLRRKKAPFFHPPSHDPPAC